MRDADAAYTARRFNDALLLYRRIAASGLVNAVRARAQSRVGYCLNARGESLPARDAWLAAAATYPDQAYVAADALNRAAGASTKTGDEPAAMDLYRKTVALYSGDAGAATPVAEALLRLGNRETRDKRHADAVVLYERALREFGGGEAAAPFLAEAQLRAGFCYMAIRIGGVRQTGRARTAFERVIARYGSELDCVAEARLQLLGLKMEDAINGLTQWIAVQTEAEAYLKAYPKERQRGARAQLMLAEILLWRDLPAEALEEAERLQAQYPDAEPAVLGTGMLNLAMCYDRTGRITQSVEAYRRFLKEFPVSFAPKGERPSAQLGLACALGALGRRGEAVEEFRRLKQDYPDSTAAEEADEWIARYTTGTGE